MNKQDAKQIVQDLTNLRVADVYTDADTVLLQIQDTDRGPRNFHPEPLAQLLQHEAVFDAWVENNEFYVQLS